MDGDELFAPEHDEASPEERRAAAKAGSSVARHMPLAARMRPRNLDEYVGQAHILGPGRLLRRAVEADRFTSIRAATLLSSVRWLKAGLPPSIPTQLNSFRTSSTVQSEQPAHARGFHATRQSRSHWPYRRAIGEYLVNPEVSAMGGGLRACRIFHPAAILPRAGTAALPAARAETPARVLCPVQLPGIPR